MFGIFLAAKFAELFCIIKDCRTISLGPITNRTVFSINEAVFLPFLQQTLSLDCNRELLLSLFVRCGHCYRLADVVKTRLMYNPYYFFYLLGPLKPIWYYLNKLHFYHLFIILYLRHWIRICKGRFIYYIGLYK